MRLIVCSDSHGNAHALRGIIEKHKGDAHGFIHLGDGLQELSRLMPFYPDQAFFYVRGNCDWSSAIPGAPAEETRSFGATKVFYTHGDRHGVKYGLEEILGAGKEAGAQVVLYGHSHMAHAHYQDGIHLLNPGSCAQSRQGPNSYLILDLTEGGAVPVVVPLP